MIKPSLAFGAFQDAGIEFFTGVPDSLLKDFCAYVTDHSPANQHVIAANEGGAVALAIGHYLATGKPAAVYLQNSGLGNTVNPLISLADPEVYSIPMVVILGWRGEPGVKDEPQHVKQGRVMLQMLESMEIPFAILPDDADGAAVQTISETVKAATDGSRPVALIVKKGTFETCKLNTKDDSLPPLVREITIERILDAISPSAIVVSTTGHASREVFESRKRYGQGHSRDFLTVGGMGHASQIALGIAMARPYRQVYCIDGDGAALMHLGAMAINGTVGMKNFHHIILNNGCHDSVGGQPSAGFKMDFPAIACATGYLATWIARDESTLDSVMPSFIKSDGPSMLEIRVRPGARADLGRPTSTPAKNKTQLMRFIHECG